MSEKNLTPEGYYRAVAVPVTGEDGTQFVRWGRSKGEAKTKQALVYFEILDGEWKGTRLTWFGYFTKDSYVRTLQSFRYMGWKGDDLASPGELDQEVSIAVEHHEWDEKIYARVAWVNAPGGGTIKLHDPLSQKELREFAAQMKERFKNVPESDGPKARKETAPENGKAGEPRNDDWPEEEEWNQKSSPAGSKAPKDRVPF